MTLAVSSRYQKYTPTVLTDTFIVPFPIFSANDLRVVVDGVDTVAFSVSATFSGGRSSDAQIILATAVVSVDVEIYGARTPRRASDYLASSPDLASNLQYDADVLTAVQQEQKRDFDRTLKVSAGIGIQPEIQNLVNSSALIYDDASKSIIPGPTADEISNAQQSALDAADSAALVGVHFYESVSAFNAATIPGSVTRVFIDNAGNELIGYRREPGASGPGDLAHPDGSDWAKATVGEADLLAAVTDAIAAAEFIDYEAGTFTPVLTFATPGDLSVTYPINGQYGSYVRIGSLVTFQIALSTITVTHTTGSGAVYITGLPFTAGANSRGMGALRTSSGIDLRDTGGGSPAVVTGLVAPGESRVTMHIIPANAVPLNMPAGRIAVSPTQVTLHLTGSYEV